MRDEMESLSLNNVASGAAVELFEHAMTEVIANILDENRSATETRKITMTFEVKANKERNNASVAVQVKTCLAPVVKADSLIFMRKERGKPKAYSYNLEEQEIFDNEGNVKPIGKKG